ncbi:MAG: hypothetical protein EXR79_04615 [Myxococcales bacterium]|nr:hypothetical protein [Myxococcales bacterium]
MRVQVPPPALSPAPAIRQALHVVLACTVLALAAWPCVVDAQPGAPVGPVAVAPPFEPAPPAPWQTLDAELRFRASRSANLSNLLAGLDSFRRGVFHRTRLGATFDRGELTARLQLQASAALGDAGPGEAPLPVGLQQGAVRWKVAWPAALELEAGRMALDYGVGRQVGRYDFHDSGNAFDGIRLRYTIGSVLAADALVVKIRRNSAQPEHERNLTGIYLTTVPTEVLRADLYFLYLADGTAKERAQILTMGARIDWQVARALRLESEVAVQVGDLQGEGRTPPRDHLASMAAGQIVGVQTLGIPLSLRMHGQFYSGDSAPKDPTSSGWRPLYPSLDEHMGLLQVVGQNNVLQAGVGVGAQPAATLRIDLDGRWTAARTGAPLPGFGQQIVAGDGSWLGLGLELDGRARWQVHAAAELALIGGMFRPSVAARPVIGPDVAWQAFVQWTSRF